MNRRGGFGPTRRNGLRGFGPLSGGGAAAPPAFDPSQIASCVTWHRADLGITLNGSNVSAWADQVGSADGVQGTAANQPAYNATDSDMSNNASVANDGSNDRIIFGGASSFNHLHNGTGGAFWMVFRSAATLANSLIMHNNTLYSGAGFYIYQNVGGTLEIRIGTGTTPIFTNSAATLAAGTVYQLLIQYTSPNWAIRLNAAATASGTEGASPSVSNAAGGLCIGSQDTGAQAWAGRVHEFATFSATLSGADLTDLETYGAAKL